jgi:hypothetical protein
LLRASGIAIAVVGISVAAVVVAIAATPLLTLQTTVARVPSNDLIKDLWQSGHHSHYENICSGYLCEVSTVFSQQDGISISKFPEKFLEISCRDLTSLQLFSWF